jgi:hypothetical protein
MQTIFAVEHQSQNNHAGQEQGNTKTYGAGNLQADAGCGISSHGEQHRQRGDACRQDEAHQRLDAVPMAAQYPGSIGGKEIDGPSKPKADPGCQRA